MNIYISIYRSWTGTPQAASGQGLAQRAGPVLSSSDTSVADMKRAAVYIYVYEY
jgi:hypothetical protein